MIDNLIQVILDFLLKVCGDSRIVTSLVAMLPIVEARLAIPIGIKYGLAPLESFLYSFIGSSLIVPILLLVLIPIIRWLSRTKIFSRVGSFLYEKFESKSAKVLSDASSATLEDDKFKKIELKKLIGVFVFVAIPLPLTGVWTGCAIASILGLSYPKSVLAVILGNLVASTIITLLTVFLGAYINIIILVLSVIALVVVISLIVKIALFKKKPV